MSNTVFSAIRQKEKNCSVFYRGVNVYCLIASQQSTDMNKCCKQNPKIFKITKFFTNAKFKERKRTIKMNKDIFMNSICIIAF